MAGDLQADITIIVWISFMVHPIPNCWRGDCNYGPWWSLWGNPEVTIVRPDTADSNTRPVNAVWWIACACERVSARTGLPGVCACASCASVSPWRASMAGWCIRWHVNYSGFRKGAVLGGSERRAGGCVVVGEADGHMWRYTVTKRTGEAPDETHHQATRRPFLYIIVGSYHDWHNFDLHVC